MSYTFYIWHTHALGQYLSMHATILTPVTLTLNSESAFWFQNLRLGFENLSLLVYQLSYTFYIWYTHALGRPFNACQIFDPFDLDLDLRVCI